MRAKRYGFDGIAQFLFEEAERKKLSRNLASIRGTATLQDATNPTTAFSETHEACGDDTKRLGIQEHGWGWFGLGKRQCRKRALDPALMLNFSTSSHGYPIRR